MKLQFFHVRDLCRFTEELEKGLLEAFEWYVDNPEKVNKRPYFAFIDQNLGGIR